MPDERNPAPGFPTPEPPFLDPEPPHWVARGLARLLLLLFVVAIVAAVLVRVPERVSGSFVLVPARGGDPVRASRDGFLTDVRAAEGLAVAAGEALFRLRSDPVGDRSAELGMLRTLLRTTEGSITLAEREYASARDADREATASLTARQAALDSTIVRRARQLAISRELAAGYQRGRQTGSIGAMEAGQAQLEAERLADQLAEAESERTTVRLALRQRTHESEMRHIRHLELVRQLRAELETASLKAGALERELAMSTGNELTIPSPCAGTVLRVRMRTPGAVVRNGDVLGEIACAGERLVGELTVPAGGVAYVRAGQGVKLLYDAFPYQRYGVRHGRIRWVGPAGVSARDSGFRALIDVDSASVLVHGTRRPLIAGMGGRADVVIGHRTLASYAVDPIRQLRENMAEGPRQ
jgi:membrane fusion protein